MDSLLSSLGLQDTRTSAAYLSYLTSLTLPQIAEQSSKLQAESQSVSQSLTALTLRESSSFLFSMPDILDPIPEMLTIVTSLESQIPALDAAATFNTSRLQEIAQSRKEAAILGRNESRLQELLDVPTLLKQCVQNGHYNEATDLSLHLNRIHARHPRSALLKSLVREMEQSMQQMALQLLSLLQTPLKLAMALKVVGFLRRSGQFQEEELRFLFLRGRYDALQEAWSGLDSLQEYPDRYVKKCVEIFREQVFAVMTQYSSIFPSSSEADQDVEQTESSFQHNLLPHFSQRVVTNLHAILQQYVPRIEDQAVKNTLLTQILYTSQSLARVGCEFANLVIHLFGDETDWALVVLNQRQMARKLD